MSTVQNSPMQNSSLQDSPIQHKATPMLMLLLGPAIMLLTLFTPPLFDGMSVESWHTLGLALWMMVGVPLTAVLLLLCWLILTKFCFQVNEGDQIDTNQMFKDKLKALGKMTKGEKLVLFFFAFAAISWIFRPIIAKITGLAISDTGIAMFVGLLLFIVPVDSKKDIRILTWDDTKKLPWGVLMLFGGGLALAGLIKKSGLADYIATQLEATSSIPVIGAVLVVTITILFLTEVTSNTATAASFLPLLGPIAVTLTEGPLMLVIPAALAASCAFMMPVATPPNAIVFSSGELRIVDMARAGFWLNIAAIAMIVLMMLTSVPWVFNL